jgi:hypothetical protein
MFGERAQEAMGSIAGQIGSFGVGLQKTKKDFAGVDPNTRQVAI